MTEWKFNDLLLKIKQGNKAAFDTLYKKSIILKCCLRQTT